MGFTIDFSVLNQKGTPALYSDIFANRPAAGYQGRLFIATDTAAIYEDTGTAWTLIANVSSGAGTLQQVTTNGNTSNVGISVTAGGVSTNSATITSLTTGSVPFAGAGGLISQDNANLFWDDTNNRLGINTNTPGNTLDVHTSSSNPTIAVNNTAALQSAISFLNTSVAKWRIGNTAINSFDIYNFTLAAYAMTINNASNAVVMSGTLNANEFNLQPTGYSLLASLSRNLTGAGYGVLSLRNSANGTIQPSSLTVDRTYTLPDATGTIALTSDLSSYLPLTGGTLTGNLTVSVNTGLSALTLNNASLSGRNWNFVNTTNGADTDLSLFYSGTSGGTKVTFANNGWVGIGKAPTTTLDVLGSGLFSGSLTANAATLTGSVTARNGSSGIAFTTTNAVDADFTVETVSGGTTKIGTSGNKLAINIGGGNVGIGVIPSPFGSGFTGFQVGAQGSHQAITTNYQVGLNYYYDGSNYKAIQTGASCKIEFDVDTIRFKNAPSVSSGATQTFTETMQIGSNGSIAIGSSTFSLTKLLITGTTAASGNFAIICNDSTNNTLFYAQNDGLINTGTRGFSPYNYPATGRAMIVEATGHIGYLVSTRESKGNIKSINDISYIFNLNPVEFNYRKKDILTNQYTEELTENINYGFIADEVEQVNKELVFYDILEDGTKKLAGVEYNNIIALLTKTVQVQQTQIESLIARIELLENK